MTIRVIRPILLQIQHLMTGMAISVVEFKLGIDFCLEDILKYNGNGKTLGNFAV